MAKAIAPKSTPKDVFLHLLAIVTLYASVISFIALFFQFINSWYPDPLNYYTSVVDSIRWSASVLVVMYPVYVLVTWLVNRDFASHPARREIKIRKWLVYLTLFISALTVIIDLISLVFYLLGGEVTIRFFLKVFVVLITAAAVFGYYLWDLRENTSRKNLKILAWSVSVLVFASIIGGFFVVGSPAKQRLLNYDLRRVSELQTIQSQVVNYWQQKNQLPIQLSDLNDSISGFSVPMDPQTGASYEYLINSPLSFELCATFNLPSPADQDMRVMPMMYPGKDNWQHAAGRTCFDRTIDPELYKNFPQPMPVQ